MEEEKNTQSINNDTHMDQVKQLVGDVGELINKYSELKDMNFGLFYQHGRLGFVDLDAFAESTKARLEADGEEKTLTELKKDIDKTKE